MMPIYSKDLYERGIAIREERWGPATGVPAAVGGFRHASIALAELDGK
jgi:hypothetical protein